MDRNIDAQNFCVCVIQSLSARRAWIEIKKKGRARRPGQVALRKESVDRNSTALVSMRASIVALRKESVDRNTIVLAVLLMYSWSLSARRAWIEMHVRSYSQF